MSRNIPILLLALVLFPGNTPGQDAEIAEADKAVEAARVAVEAAEVRLAGDYALLLGDFEFFRSEAWDRLRAPVMSGVLAAGEACRKDPDLDRKALLVSHLTKAGLLSAVSVEILAGEIAPRLAEADETSVAEALNKLFPAPGFEECWPALMGKLGTVGDLRAAHEALGKAVSARKALDVAPGDPGAPPGMVLVPKGRFKFGPWIGWDADLEDARISNKQKTERLNGFFIDVHEVTNARFREFLAGLGNSKIVAEYRPAGFAVAEDGTVTSPAGKDDHPVVGVTLAAAMAYARSVGKRLPTEAEWEKAARGEDGRTYPWGEKLEEEAANWKGRKLGGTTAVGTHPKDVSPYGVLDMAGNVSELTMTLTGRRPVRGKLEAEDSVVIRGGSFDEDDEALGTTYRWILRADGGSSESVGFRCVMNEKDWPQK